MKLNPEHLRLYLVTDNRWLNGQSLAGAVESAIKGGVTMVQYRNKDAGREEYLKQALLLKKITSHYNIPLLINDHVDIALECDADGVHLGQKDTSISDARKILGDAKIIGASARTPEQAVFAQESGADYLGCGQVFKSGTKLDTIDVSHSILQSICEAVDIPVAAIGGITRENVELLAGRPIAGCAVVSAVLAAADITAAAKEMNNIITKIVLGL